MKTVDFLVDDMTCAACVSTIKKRLSKVEGINSVNINLPLSKVRVEFEDNLINEEKIIEVINSAGYNAKLASLQDVSLFVEGMTCAACVASVERAVKKVEGVKGVSVNLATKKASITFDDEITGLADINQAIKHAGYTPKTIESNLTLKNSSKFY